MPESIPENVSFRVADAMGEPPVDLLGKFDIVHLRLFFCVVDKNDPLPAFNFCLKLLSNTHVHSISLPHPLVLFDSFFIPR